MSELLFHSGIDDGFEKDLKKMNSKLNEFTSHAQKSAAEIDKAYERAFETAPKDVQELNALLTAQQGVVKQLEKEYEKTAKAVEKVPAGMAKMKMLDELEKQKQAIEEESAALQGLRDSKGQTGQATVQLRTQLMKMRDEMASLRIAGKQNTEEYRTLELQMGKLGTAYREVQTAQKAMSTGASQIQGVVQGVQGLMGAYTMGSGVIGAFTSDNEKLQEIQTRMQSSMAILMGMQQVANALHSTSAFRITTVASVTRLWNAVNGRASAGLMALGVSAKFANVASKALIGTLTLGLSVAIGAAIVMINRYSAAKKKAREETEAQTKAVQEGSVKQITAFVSLQRSFNSLEGDAKKQAEWLEKNKKGFEDLGLSVVGVTDAERILNQQADVFVQSMYKRALALYNYEKAQDVIKKRIEDEAQLERLRTSTSSTSFVGRMLGGQGVAAAGRQLAISTLSASIDTAMSRAQEYLDKFVHLNAEVDAAFDEMNAGTGKTVAQQLESLELLYTQRQNNVKKTITDDKEMQRALLENEMWYLKQRKRLAETALDKEKIEGQMIDVGIRYAGMTDNPLQQLELQYAKALLISKRNQREQLTSEEQFKIQLLELEKTHIQNILKYEKQELAVVRLRAREEEVDAELAYALEQERLRQRDRFDIMLDAKAEILRLEKELQKEISNAQAQELLERIEEQKKIIEGAELYTGEKELGTKVSQAATVFAHSIQGINSELATLAQSIGSVFDAFQEGGTSAARITSVISLVTTAIRSTAEFSVRQANKQARQYDEMNKTLLQTMRREQAYNDILQARREISEKINVFMQPHHVDTYTAAIQASTVAQSRYNDAITALQDGIEGMTDANGRSRIYDLLTADSLYDRITRSLYEQDVDATGIFAEEKRVREIQKRAEEAGAAVNSTLEQMGKKAGDMAQFSAEEWEMFFSVLEKGGHVANETTKALIQEMQEAASEYQAAMDEMLSVIESVAGSLGNALSDSMVRSIREGTDAMEDFGNSLNDVLLQMAKAEMNKMFFKGLFDSLQAEMQSSMTPGGDMNWEDDLLRFYSKLPDAIGHADTFLRQFDAQMKEMGFAGVEEPTAQQGRAGMIRQAITEDTGTELVGRLAAIMLSNERMAMNSAQMMDVAVRQLMLIGQIAQHTEFLPEIADNTRRTYQALGNI
jgi:hypothetical protein